MYHQPVDQPEIMAAGYHTDWTSGLFECCSDMDVCCDFFWCHACNVARQYDATQGLNDSLNVGICLVNTFCYFTYCTNCMVRCEVARIFGLKEEGLASFCIAAICPSCSACQTHRELLFRGRFPGGTLCATKPPLTLRMDAPPLPPGRPYQETTLPANPYKQI